MRKRSFSSYGPVDIDLNYFAPRTALVDQAVTQLIGEVPNKGGHYFTVWAPRQRGKTWILLAATRRLIKDLRFLTVKLSLQTQVENDFPLIANRIFKLISEMHPDRKFPTVTGMDDFKGLFTKECLDRPLILILDEFDALEPEVISKFATCFRDIYIARQDMISQGQEPKYLLHGVCLIGVRSVLGVENRRGSPFNVQRSMQIPNLEKDEVVQMFRDYEAEWGQKVDQEVIDTLYYEVNGQPGLTSWFGELLTSSYKYNDHPDQPITMKNWKNVYVLATNALPENNVMNLISKARDERYKPTILNLFNTQEKTPFKVDQKDWNYLYMNGVVDYEKAEDGELYAKFPCPFVQKRLFNYFSDEVFNGIYVRWNGEDRLLDAVMPDRLVVKPLLQRAQQWLDRMLKEDYFLKHAPRRSDQRVIEAVWHFQLFLFLSKLLTGFKVSIYPEFPTGNGKVDLLMEYQSVGYAIEVKAFSNHPMLLEAKNQAGNYAMHLGIPRITLAVFVDKISDEYRAEQEADFEYVDATTGSLVTVETYFIITGDY